MSELDREELESAHLDFAKRANGRVWELLGKGDRTDAEIREMVHAAHASMYHWLQVGTPVNTQRGEWLLARVYTQVGDAEAAIRHAERCQVLTEAHPDLMQDFDRAYALEGLARAYVTAGEMGKGGEYRDLAQSAGEKIANAESREIFFDDLQSGDWRGL
jgi:hypothetical protein